MIKGFLTKKTQSGRTMTEMITVLAIIAVLSIGGIMGYRLAMQYYRENQTLNALSVATTGARTWELFERYGDKAIERPYYVPIREVISRVDYRTNSTADEDDLNDKDKALEHETFFTLINAPVWVRMEDEHAYTVRIAGVSKGLCEKIVRTNLGNTYTYRQPDNIVNSPDITAAKYYFASQFREANSSKFVSDFCATIDGSTEKRGGFATPAQVFIPHLDRSVRPTVSSVETELKKNNAHTLVLYFGDVEHCLEGPCGPCAISKEGRCERIVPPPAGCPCSGSDKMPGSCYTCNGTVVVNTTKCPNQDLCDVTENCISNTPYFMYPGNYSSKCCSLLPSNYAGQSAWEPSPGVCCIDSNPPLDWQGNNNSLCGGQMCYPLNPFDPELFDAGARHPDALEGDFKCCSQMVKEKLGFYVSDKKLPGIPEPVCCALTRATVVEDPKTHEFTKKGYTALPGNDVFGKTPKEPKACCEGYQKNKPTAKDFKPWYHNDSSHAINSDCCDNVGGVIRNYSGGSSGNSYVGDSSYGEDFDKACCNPTQDGLNYEGKKDKNCCNPATPYQKGHICCSLLSNPPSSCKESCPSPCHWETTGSGTICCSAVVGFECNVNDPTTPGPKNAMCGEELPCPSDTYDTGSVCCVDPNEGGGKCKFGNTGCALPRQSSSTGSGASYTGTAYATTECCCAEEEGANFRFPDNPDCSAYDRNGSNP